MLYRLSGIENESEEEEQDQEQNVVLPKFEMQPDESLFNEWQSPFNLSEFQPNQFFTNWDDPSSAGTKNDDQTTVTSNGNDHGKISSYSLS